MNPDADLTEARALAIGFANLKSPGPKDLLGAARALLFLRKLYGSRAKVAKSLDVSPEIVREFLVLLKLPPDVQTLFENRQLATLEHGRRLAQLMGRRPTIVSETAGLLTSMTAHDARAVVEHLLRHPTATPREAVSAVEDGRTQVRNEIHVIALLGEGDFRSLSRAAQVRKVPVSALVTNIVREWLARVDGSRRNAK